MSEGSVRLCQHGEAVIQGIYPLERKKFPRFPTVPEVLRVEDKPEEESGHIYPC